MCQAIRNTGNDFQHQNVFCAMLWLCLDPLERSEHPSDLREKFQGKGVGKRKKQTNENKKERKNGSIRRKIGEMCGGDVGHESDCEKVMEERQRKRAAAMV